MADIFSKKCVSLSYGLFRQIIIIRKIDKNRIFPLGSHQLYLEKYANQTSVYKFSLLGCVDVSQIQFRIFFGKTPGKCHEVGLLFPFL